VSTISLPPQFGFIGLQAHVRSQHSIEQLKSHCIEQLKSHCIEQLGELFGSEALNPEKNYLKDWAEDKWVATDQDVMEPPRHASFAMVEHKKELESLRLHLAASEFAQLEAGYLEGALLASDTVVKTVIACSQKLEDDIKCLK
jgi:monoamine oxidase